MPMVCESIYDKGNSGAIVNVHLESRDDDGAVVFENRAVIVDPAKLRSFSARFMDVVYPGETLIVSGWKREAGNYIVQVTAGDGRIVLGNALAELN